MCFLQKFGIMDFYLYLCQKLKMRTIILPNRYGVENKLVQIGEKLWTIESEYPISICYTDSTRGQIYFIDVEGGFPVGSGTEIEGVVIESIKCEDNKIIIYEQ